MIYRGSWPAPLYEHGAVITVGMYTGIIQHRSHNGKRWEYGLLVDGIPGITWVPELPDIIASTRPHNREDM